MIPWTLVKRQEVYHVRYRIPAPEPGRPRRTLRCSRSTGERTNQRALVAAQRIVAEAEADLIGRKPSCSLGDLGREWLAVNSRSVSEAHWKAMERHLRLHFTSLRDLDLKGCTTAVVKAALNAYREDHGEGSALTWRRYLRTLFGWAVTTRRLEVIPWSQKDLGKMKARQRPRPILPVERWAEWLRAVAAASGDPMDPRPRMVAMMLATGLREMEVVRARWEWLDLERGTYTPGNLPGGEARTKGGEAQPRAIPTWLAGLLRPLQQPEGWMFIDLGTGCPFGRGCCRRLIQAANKSVGTPGIMHHRLRATIATLLLARVSPRDAQEAMAHKDPRTTLVYNETNPGAVRNALDSLGLQAGLR